jgi:hypothetical protein
LISGGTYVRLASLFPTHSADQFQAGPKACLQLTPGNLRPGRAALYRIHLGPAPEPVQRRYDMLAARRLTAPALLTLTLAYLAAATKAGARVAGSDPGWHA